jgi:hypothetical protein
LVRWMSAFAVGFAVSLPISLIFVPLIRRFVEERVCVES